MVVVNGDLPDQFSDEVFVEFGYVKIYISLRNMGTFCSRFFAKPTKKALKKARETIAFCIDADLEEIYFTSGGKKTGHCISAELSRERKNRTLKG